MNIIVYKCFFWVFFIVININSHPFQKERKQSTNSKIRRGLILFAIDAIRKGVVFVTDTNMAKSGINKTALEKLGCETMCFMSDKDVAETARKNSTTRATASVDKAAALGRPIIYAVGNAPTALIRLYELMESGTFRPELIIGVPVGFVNVVQSKEMIMESGVPYIIAKGRKGGSNVAAAICNALLYMAGGR